MRLLKTFALVLSPDFNFSIFTLDFLALKRYNEMEEVNIADKI